MIFSWWRRRKRRQLLARPAESYWNERVGELALLERLDGDQRRRLIEIARVFSAEKRWEGANGQEITPEVTALISLQASLLLLEREHDYFRNVKSIFVYPSGYRTPRRSVRGDGTVGEGSANLGEAWHRGPVVLAYDEVLKERVGGSDARNLVLHEFAHKLDFLDDLADGTPPLEGDHQREEWRRVMTTAFEDLRERLEDGDVTFLDEYGATNAAEFFAVVTETFFERPEPLRNRHPDLYRILAQFYRQDPAASEKSSEG